MKLLKLKQGTLNWEKVREKRIGSSEVFDIVRYYATDEEIQNCGINAERLRSEKPYTTVWALYHKMIGSGLYHKGTLAPELAEYGHIVEPYGAKKLQKGREKKLKAGAVYADDRLIASLDLEGVAEEMDEVSFVNGPGAPKRGQRFVCEQKSMMPTNVKKGLPMKYVIQAQYQIAKTKADFYILQLMVLDEDTVFLRGKLCGMSAKKREAYFDEHLKVSLFYFKNNEQLSRLIEVCLSRFFDDVDKKREPRAFIEYDSAANIIESIRLNALYHDGLTLDQPLEAYLASKDAEEEAESHRKEELQKIVDFAKENNCCRFRSQDGTTAMFDKRGSLRVKRKEEAI